MKTRRLQFFAFIMLVGVIMTFSSCKKNNDTPNLIGTWCVKFEDVGREYDITFNIDGKGLVNFHDLDDEYEYSEPFSYIFNGKDGSVTFININYSYAVYFIMEIWEVYYPGYYKDSKQYACSFKVQIKNKTLELTDSNNLTVPFTRQ